LAWAALASAAVAGEKPTLSMSCSVGKDKFLVGEPITLRCTVAGAVEKFRGEPWLFETGGLAIYVRTAGGDAVRRVYESTSRYSPVTRGLRVPTGARLVFEREILVGSILGVPKGGHTTFEDRSQAEGADFLRASSRLKPGRYELQCWYGFGTRNARRLLGNNLSARISFEVVSVSAEERDAANSFSIRPLESRESRKAVAAQFEDICKRYPDSAYAPWARYYADVLKLELGEVNALQSIHRLASSDDSAHLPRYEMAYLVAHAVEKFGFFQRALKVVDSQADKDTLVFLDTLKTGEQLEGWRYFELQRRLREAIEFSAPREDEGDAEAPAGGR
jgi:hypothetical protein